MHSEWSEHQFGACVSLCRNGMTYTNQNESGGLPISRIETISEGKINLSKVGSSGLLLNECGSHMLEEGDILFSHINSLAHVGKVALVEERFLPMVHGMNLLRMKPSKLLTSEYLFLVLQSSEFRAEVMSRSQVAVNQVSLNIGSLKEINVTVPPSHVQKRIVDVVSSVDVYIDALQRQADTTRTARNAVAEEAINSGFPTCQLSQIGRTVTGSTPSTKRPEYWEPAEVDFITPGDFGEQLLIRNASRRVSREGAKASRALRSYSVLQVCIGATIGKVGYVSHNVVTNQQINSVVGLEELDAYFVSLMLSTNELQVNICDRAGTTTLPIISKSAWGELSIPWPDAQIREGISLLAKSIDEYILATDNAVADAKNLRSGLLSDLLSGKHEIPASYDSLLGAA